MCNFINWAMEKWETVKRETGNLGNAKFGNGKKMKRKKGKPEIWETKKRNCQLTTYFQHV
jgi:hypothetical protein